MKVGCGCREKKHSNESKDGARNNENRIHETQIKNLTLYCMLVLVTSSFFVSTVFSLSLFLLCLSVAVGELQSMKRESRDKRNMESGIRDIRQLFSDC